MAEWITSTTCQCGDLNNHVFNVPQISSNLHEIKKIYVQVTRIEKAVKNTTIIVIYKVFVYVQMS